MYVAAPRFYKGDRICGFFSHLFQGCPTFPLSTAREPGGWLQSVTGSWSLHRPTPSLLSFPFPLLLPLTWVSKASYSLPPGLTPFQCTLPPQPGRLRYRPAYNPSRLLCIQHKPHSPHQAPRLPMKGVQPTATSSLWSPPSLGAWRSRLACAFSSLIHAPSSSFGEPSPSQLLGARSPPGSAQYLLYKAPLPSSCFLLGSHSKSHLQQSVALTSVRFCWAASSLRMLTSFVFHVAGMLSGTISIRLYLMQRMNV